MISISNLALKKNVMNYLWIKIFSKSSFLISARPARPKQLRGQLKTEKSQKAQHHYLVDWNTVQKQSRKKGSNINVKDYRSHLKCKLLPHLRRHGKVWNFPRISWLTKNYSKSSWATNPGGHKKKTAKAQQAPKTFKGS